MTVPSGPVAGPCRSLPEPPYEIIPPPVGALVFCAGNSEECRDVARPSAWGPDTSGQRRLARRGSDATGPRRSLADAGRRPGDGRLPVADPRSLAGAAGRWL